MPSRCWHRTSAKTIVFTRVGNPKSSGMQGDCKSGAQADELRRVRVEGTGDELLVRGQEGKDPKDSICEFRRKQFSSDGRYLFSLTPAWATSGALHVYDTRDKKLSFVMPANDMIVLSACKSADSRDLVVQRHRFRGGGKLRLVLALRSHRQEGEGAGRRL